MWVIFFIYVAIYNVESVKIRATHRTWIQYPSSNQHIVVPNQNQYGFSQYRKYNQPVVPMTNNAKIIYRWDTGGQGGQRMFGNGNFGASNANLTSIITALGGQIQQNGYQIKPSFGGLVGQAGYQNWQNQGIRPIVYQGQQNGGENVDLTLNQKITSESSGQNDYSFKQSVLNTVINSSGDQNVIQDENTGHESLFVENHDVDRNVKAELSNINNGNVGKEKSGASFFAADDNVTLSHIENINSDQAILDEANEASLQDNGNDISIHNEENTRTLNVLTENNVTSQGDAGILSKNQTQNKLTEAPSTNIPKEYVPIVSTVNPMNNVTSKDLISHGDEYVPIDTEPNNVLPENDLIKLDENNINTIQRRRLDAASIQDILKQWHYITPENSASIPQLPINQINPLVNGVYSIKQNNLNRQYTSPMVVNKQYKILENPGIYPFIWAHNQQQINRYRMPIQGYPIPGRIQLYGAPGYQNMANIPPNQVNNPSFCQNPFLNVIRPNNQVIPANYGLGSLLQALQMYGIQDIPRYIDNNQDTTQTTGMQYKFEGRRPINSGFTNGAYTYQSNLYGINPFMYQTARDNNLPPNSAPIQNQGYVAYSPNDLIIQTEMLKANEENNINIKAQPRSTNENQITETDFEKVDHITEPEIMNTDIIMRDGYNTPVLQDELHITNATTAEQFIGQITAAIISDLERFNNNKCNSEDNAKILEGIKALIDSLHPENCKDLPL